MKTILLFTLILLSLSSFSQDKYYDIFTVVDGMITYSNVIPVDSAKKDVLYARAKKWFANNYRSSKDVIQLDDNINGEIIGKGTFTIQFFTRSPFIDHTIAVSVKDGKYKYTINHFIFEGADANNRRQPIESFPNNWAGKKKFYTRIDEEVKLTIASLQKAMTTNEKADW